MERVKFITHKGKEILLINGEGCSAQEALVLAKEAMRTIAAQPEHSLLILTNVQNAHFNLEVSAAMKEFTVHNKPYVKKSALFGVTGIQRVIYNAALRFSGRDIPVFDDFEQAKDWLVTD